jgi:catechol 2,3-dioxygenase-like lactoylglutathione lyase family enzyme
MNFQTLVVNVADLDKSLEFYRDILGFTELSRKDQLAAVYAAGNPRPQVIVLRALATTGRLGGARHTGIRSLVLEADSLEDLDRITAELDKRGFLESRRDTDTWTATFARDPDHTSVVIGTGVGSEPITLDAWAELDEGLYGVGE